MKDVTHHKKPKFSPDTKECLGNISENGQVRRESGSQVETTQLRWRASGTCMENAHCPQISFKQDALKLHYTECEQEGISKANENVFLMSKIFEIHAYKRVFQQFIENCIC